jgi:hypothetical protein
VTLMLRVLVVAVVLFGVQALLVAAIAAVRKQGNIYATIISVSVATTPLVFMAGSSIVGHPLSADGRLYLALMHLSLGGFLFHFMTLPDRSVTLRIFVELLLAPGRTLSLEALGSRYGVRTMIVSRLEQLQEGGFLSIAPDGALALLPRGQWFGRFVTGGRRLFRITSAN